MGTNSFKIWEPFVAAVLPFPAGGDEDAGAAVFDAAMALSVTFSVGPIRGTLAPQGGANNVCDPSRPYSDSATVSVLWEGGRDGAVLGVPPVVPAGGVALVVKTEEEQWTYQ